MPPVYSDWKSGLRTVSMVVLAGSSISLAGCAGVGDGALSGAFVDPAKYELYDCKQLEAERKSLEARSTELQGYIDKARTGTAGTVVGEVAYRNDYISTRASLKLANEAWERGKCVATAAPPPATTPASKGKGRAGH
ncbi:MAG: twin-arginine translocation pathway signal [Rhizobiales bacterium]|nr:twin-arginine translocation pathway signal [Hyphomicrobiales bacterium]